MSALREIYARFGIDFDDKPLEAGAAGVNHLVDKLKTLGGLLAGGALVHGVRSFVHHITEVTQEFDNLAQSTGLSFQELQAWGYGAEQLGIPLHGVEQMLAELTKRATEAGEGNKAFAKHFRAMGVAVKDAHGEMRPMQEVLLDFSDALRDMPDQAERVTRTMAILGADGRKLLPILQQGREGFEHLNAEVLELGGGLGEDMRRAAAGFSNATARMDISLLSLQSRIGVLLLPIFERMTTMATGLISGFNRLAKDTKILEAAFVVLGTVAAVAAAKILLPFLPIIATMVAIAVVITGVVLVVEDLLMALDGGKSVLGDFTDAMEDFFEMNRDQKGFIGDLAREWEGYVRTVERAIAVLREWFGFGPSVEEMYGERTSDPAARGLSAPGQGVTAAQDAARAASRPAESERTGTQRGLGGGGERIRTTPEEIAAHQARFAADQARLAARPEALAARSVAADWSRARRPVAGEGAGGGTVSQEITFNITGQPAETERVVRRVLDEQLRNASDAFNGGGEEL